MNKSLNKRGFTLVELLIVIVVIGLLVSGVLVAVNVLRNSGRDTKRITDIDQLRNALENYRKDWGFYPTAITSGQSLVAPNGVKTYMAKIPTAPTPADGTCTTNNNAYTYTVGASSQTYSLLYCVGKASNNNQIVAGLNTATPVSSGGATCVASCSGNCGSDGCGGSCGACTGFNTCGGGGVGGTCGCTTTCGGNICGSDGCGGTCGAGCAAWQACSGGTSCVQDSYTTLLLHMDGNFTDSSTKNHTMTTHGSATTNSGTKKFGSASGYFSYAGGSYLSTTDASDFNLNGSDGTVDFWFYSTSGIGGLGLVQFGNTTIDYSDSWADPKWQVTVYINSILAITTPANSLSSGAWHHVALVIAGGSSKLYVDGVQQGSTYAGAPSDSPTTLNVAYAPGGASNGYMDEFRFSKGIARWTTNFTPPSAAY